MSTMGHSGWRLTAEFPPRQCQEEDSPEYAWPYDHATRLIEQASSAWGGIIEDFTEDVKWADDGTWVTLDSEVIDAFVDIMPWLLMSTIPIRLTLAAIDADGKPIPTVGEM